MSKKCPDCGVEPNNAHHEGCDIERCSVCKGQRLMCSMMDGGCNSHEPNDVKWDGRWPGEKECEELGWFVRMYPDGKIGGRCGKDDPYAFPDLTRWTVFQMTGKDTYNE